MSEPAAHQIVQNSQGVFFDLYGTLLIYGDMNQAWSDWLDCFRRFMANLGLNMSRGDFANRCQDFFSWPDPPENSNLTLYERRIHTLVHELGIKMSLDQARSSATESVNAWQAHITLDAEAPKVLEKLRETKRALVSNFDHPPHVRSVLKETELVSFFDSIIVSAKVGFRKPDPRIFDQALSATQLDPHQVVYVGDSSEDIEGALAAGMTPILIRRPAPAGANSGWDFRSDKDKPMPGSEFEIPKGTAVISSLSELLPSPTVNTDQIKGRSQ